MIEAAYYVYLVPIFFAVRGVIKDTVGFDSEQKVEIRDEFLCVHLIIIDRLWGIAKMSKSLHKMVATAQLMLAMIKGVANVGVVLSLKPILKSWHAYHSNLMF